MDATGGHICISRRLMEAEVFFFLLALLTLVAINLLKSQHLPLCKRRLIQEYLTLTQIVDLKGGCEELGLSVASLISQSTKLSKPPSTSLSCLQEKHALGLCSLPLPVI